MTAPPAVRRTVRAPDGTALAVTAVPTGRPGPAPVVLVRTPYGSERLLAEARGWARGGFTCVLADVRGRFASGGTFTPYRHEEGDGAAVLDWVLRQEFCDGTVIAAGASYGAYCALALGVSGHPAVRGVLAAVPAMGPGETAREPGGAARLACRVGWWAEHGGSARPRSPAPEGAALLAAVPPIGILDHLLTAPPPGWRDLWRAARRGPLWARLSAARPPLLAVGGLHDAFAADTLELARAWGGAVRLLLGPWGHELDARRPGAALGGRRIGRLYLDWARAAARGTVTGRRELLAVTGDGQWRRLPPPGARH
ncbi:CocE/NonD family hydrolase, partial [Marinitenerispora sediminis]